MEVMYLVDDLSSSFEFIIKNFDRKRQTNGDGVSLFYYFIVLAQISGQIWTQFILAQFFGLELSTFG